jgi:hypothetical protein
MSCPSLWVVDIPAQWDARDAKRWFCVREGSPTGVPLVRGLFLEEWEETQWVHGTDDYVFAEGFLPHW